MTTSKRAAVFGKIPADDVQAAFRAAVEWLVHDRTDETGHQRTPFMPRMYSAAPARLAVEAYAATLPVLGVASVEQVMTWATEFVNWRLLGAEPPSWWGEFREVRGGE